MISTTQGGAGSNSGSHWDLPVLPSNRKALETALLRSPFYDEKSRAEAMRDLQDAIGGPPLDDVATFMSPGS